MSDAYVYRFMPLPFPHNIHLDLRMLFSRNGGPSSQSVKIGILQFMAVMQI